MRPLLQEQTEDREGGGMGRRSRATKARKNEEEGEETESSLAISSKMSSPGVKPEGRCGILPPPRSGGGGRVWKRWKLNIAAQNKVKADQTGCLTQQSCRLRLHLKGPVRARFSS